MQQSRVIGGQCTVTIHPRINPCNLMDKMRVYETRDAGSNPAKGAKSKRNPNDNAS